MATPIDCRAYYIDNPCNVDEKSNETLCQNFNNNNDNVNDSDTGSGFSISKYLIDDKTETGYVSSNFSACQEHRDKIICVVHNLTIGAANAVVAAAENDAKSSTSCHARQRSVRGRLRRAVYRLETLMRDVKAVARDFRRHMIVHSDHVHRRQTTSGLTDTPDHNDDDVVVLRNISGCDNHARRSAASMVVEGKRRVDDGNTGAAFSRDLNWNWRSTSTDAGKYVDDSVQDVSSDVPEQLVPEIQQRRTSSSSLSNRLCVDSGRTYNDSAAMDDFAGVEAELQLYRKPSETPSAGSRTQVPLHRRMVASATRQTTRTAAATTKRESVVMRSSACSVREVVPCVWRRTETVFTPRVRVPDEVVPTFASNYSGVYERDLEDILESAATVSCCRSRRRRCHRNMAAADAFPSSHDDKFYFRLPPPPEVQSHRSSSPDSCYERSDSEPADRKSCASSDDDEEKELKLDEEQLTPAEAYAAFDCTASSFYRRLNHFLLSGNHGPAMHATVIEP